MRAAGVNYISLKKIDLDYVPDGLGGTHIRRVAGGNRI